MTHYICTGGCGGVAQVEGTCQADTCPKHGLPLEQCDCADEKHRKVEEGKGQTEEK